MIITTIKEDFEKYLKLVYPNYKIMVADQRKQIEQAYYAAVANISTKIMYDIPKLPEIEAGEALTKIDNEVKAYWKQYLAKDKKS